MPCQSDPIFIGNSVTVPEWSLGTICRPTYSHDSITKIGPNLLFHIENLKYILVLLIRKSFWFYKIWWNIANRWRCYSLNVIENILELPQTNSGSFACPNIWSLLAYLLSYYNDFRPAYINLNLNQSKYWKDISLE